MNRKVFFLLMVLTIVGIGALGWYLLQGITRRSVASMSIWISLSTTPIQSSMVGNGSVVSFVMEPNTSGDFTFSLVNNGTMRLENVYFRLDQISSGLSLTAGDEVVRLPYTLPIGSILVKDSRTYGAFTILSPPTSGNYEMAFRVTSDKVNYSFRVIITVA